MTDPSTARPPETGIASIGLHLPPLAMDVRELAALRGVDPNKYTLGLGCNEMALCGDRVDVVQLAAEAGRRAIARWGGDPARIGLLAVGTETARDMSRPLSAFVAESLGLSGALRSYEVKHACYGGTVALRQALEWRASGAAAGKAALVVAADVALYAPGDPGEPTQGAGAVAMVVDDARVARVDLTSHPYAEPAFDFWRPVGEAYPRVDGPLSLECYMRAAEACFGAWVGDGDAAEAFETLEAACFHVPFPKMVKKAVMRLGTSFGWDEATTAAFFEQKVAPTMRYNRRVGNAYTASLWLSVADALAGLPEGRRIGAFSYGSGFGSELLLIEAGPEAQSAGWTEDYEADLKARRLVDRNEYERLRA
ncbi:MAG: hydroxymethylglutaryl-CoA synthase family protein [Myxococcota bacterium]